VRTPKASRNPTEAFGKILHEVLWSAMRPRIAFTLTLTLYCAPLDPISEIPPSIPCLKFP
jgi:hypothetical protein